MIRSKGVILFLLLLSMGVAFYYYCRYNRPPALLLPELDLTDINGKPFSLNQYKGRPIFVSFFASWCGPCIYEMPALVELETQLKNQQLQVICISDDGTEKIKALDQRFGGRLVFLHSTKPLHDLGIYTYPTNYILNRKAEKVYDKVNPEDWSESIVIERVRKLIDRD